MFQVLYLSFKFIKLEIVCKTCTMIMPFSWKEETTKIGTRYLQEIKYKMFVELLGNNTPMTIYSETQVDTWINR